MRSILAKLGYYGDVKPVYGGEKPAPHSYSGKRKDVAVRGGSLATVHTIDEETGKHRTRLAPTSAGKVRTITVRPNKRNGENRGYWSFPLSDARGND